MADVLYTVERVIDAPIASLWTLWTDPDHLAAWYGPVGFNSPRESVTMEPHLGGAWSATVVAPMDGSHHHFYGVITEISEPNVLHYSMRYTNDDDVFAARDRSSEAHEVVITLDEVEGGVRMTFSQIGTFPEGQAEQAKAGIESYFDSFESHLATLA